MTKETNSITGETRTRLTYTQLGEIMLKAFGVEACQKAYGATKVNWIGRYALDSGDINPDGTLN